MALDAAQIEDYRLTIGDDELTHENAYILSDTQLNTLHTAASGIYPLAVVFMLRRVLGWCRKKVNQSNDIGTTEQYQQLYQNTKDLLAYWEDVYKEYAETPLGEDGSDATNSEIEGLGVLDLDLNYYDWPLDDGHYAENVALLDSYLKT